MHIKTERLIIRDIKIEDEVSFVKMAEDGTLNDIGFDKNCSEWMSKWMEETQELVLKNNPNIEYLAYTIALKGDNNVVGSVGCSYYEDFQKVGITYFIGAKYRNNGYAIEAVKAYLKYFFEHYDITEIIATIREKNIASWNVVEKLDFQFVEKKMYQDLNDATEEMYRFYKKVK